MTLAPSRFCREWAIGWAAALGVGGAAAAPVDDLLNMDFQRLLAMQVVTVTRVEQQAFSLPAALVVLSNDDIRRSGHRHLADLLRDVPGLHVGRLDGNKWAVSSRNAMSRFASTLLVMIDGRPVFTPLTGGVRWEAISLPLLDVERVEVVRGPGGPLWGANAVDGVINVVTRPAQATQGTAVDLAAGHGGDASSLWTIRHGDRLGERLQWRVQAQGMEFLPGRYPSAQDSTHRGLRQPGTEALDEGWQQGISARLDGQPDDANRWSLHLLRSRSRFGEERASTLRPPLPNRMRYDAAAVVAEWNHRADSAAGVARFSSDWLSTRDDILRDDQRIFDLDLQWSDRWNRHQWTVGLGWRDYRSISHLPPGSANCVACFGVWPPKGGSATFSAFAQDQWQMSPDWVLTAGAKLEQYRPGTHSLQPTLRLAWTPSPEQTLWTALTRAVRSPTRLERDRAAFNVPPALQGPFGCWRVEGNVCLSGAPDLPLWKATVIEVGGRARLAKSVDLDLSAFSSRYQGDRQAGAGTPERRPRIEGLESSLRWQLMPSWSLAWHGTLHRGSERPLGTERVDMRLLPERSWLLQSRWSPRADWDVDLRLQRVSELRRANTVPLPGHWRADVRLAWRDAQRWEWSLQAQRLNQPQAAEYLESLKVNTVGTRGLMLGLRAAL